VWFHEVWFCESSQYNVVCEIKLEKVQITSLKYSESSDNPLNMFWFNLPPKLSYLVQLTS
jgi:hypothetical protein